MWRGLDGTEQQDARRHLNTQAIPGLRIPAGGDDDLPRAYWAATTRATPPLDEVRARIPGWGVDLNYEDRPAVPMEDFDPGATNAHWHFPERQPEKWPREMSPEHGMLPPVLYDEPIAHQHYGGTSRTYAGDADADYDARAPEDTYEAYLR